MSEEFERDWPPDASLTDDQKKRYRYLRNNLRWGEAFIYNELCSLHHKLDKKRD